MDRRTFLSAVPITTATVLAGCSGSGGESSPTETRPQTSTDVTSQPTDPATGSSPTETATRPSGQEAYPEYNWTQLEGAAVVVTDSITMRGSAFHPLVAAVEPGTTMSVTNEDSFGHTITIPKLGVAESLSGGGSTSVTVEQTGTFDYVCELHPPGMLGRLLVTEDPATAMDTPSASPTQTASPEPTDTPTDSSTKTATETPTPSVTPSASVTVEATSANAFTPERVHVAVGGTVTWENTDTGPYGDHTVTSAQFHDEATEWAMDERLAGGESVSRTFDSDGIYEYYCSIHGRTQMCGVVLVGDATLDKDLPCE